MLIDGCLRYMREAKLPMPLPATRAAYAEWRERVLAPRMIAEDAEEAWFELDRLVAEQPNAGWKLLLELTSRCEDEDACAQIAAGPLNTFIHAHGDAFSSRIDEELLRNARFRAAYNWLQR